MTTKGSTGAARGQSKPHRKCGVVYDGTSFPEEHGVTCFLPAGHDVGAPHGPQKHSGKSRIEGRPSLNWYTAAQKAARHAENKGIRAALRVKP